MNDAAVAAGGAAVFATIFQDVVAGYGFVTGVEPNRTYAAAKHQGDPDRGPRECNLIRVQQRGSVLVERGCSRIHPAKSRSRGVEETLARAILKLKPKLGHIKGC